MKTAIDVIVILILLAGAFLAGGDAYVVALAFLAGAQSLSVAEDFVVRRRLRARVVRGRKLLREPEDDE